MFTANPPGARTLTACAVVAAMTLTVAGCSHSPEQGSGTMPAHRSATTAPPAITATSWNGITMPADAVPHDRGQRVPGERLTFTYRRGAGPTWTREGELEAWIYERAVRNIQQRLGTKADGVFDARTEQAVKKAQLSHHLPATGEVDSQTCRALGLHWNAQVDYG